MTAALLQEYQRIRHTSAAICAPLARDDYQLQSIVETSPPKWHLGHVTWFFETFVLQAFVKGYQPFRTEYNYLFNSYYQTVGSMQPRAERGLMSRPTVEEVYAYRAAIDERMMALLTDADPSQAQAIAARVTLGLHHEQQHGEFERNGVCIAVQCCLPSLACNDHAKHIGGVR
jgi:hypothetical protein